MREGKTLISGGLEPPTFCVLDRCDDHYTTRSVPLSAVSKGIRGSEVLAVSCLLREGKTLISGGFEPPTFCVLDRCDDHYTTRSVPSLLSSEVQAVSCLLREGKTLISGGLEPPTFCVLDICDNHYTTRSVAFSAGSEVRAVSCLLREGKTLISGGLEPPTFCVLFRCDNHYTTRSVEFYAVSKGIRCNISLTGLFAMVEI
uniref:Sema domain-containing protein n=1 Tax=Angiostrongylus cantonensis TaxID=6313 RepID=A0A0K0D880_ANGCA